MSTVAFLTQENLENAFQALGMKARAAQKLVEIAVYGGSALVLTLPGRVATKDVDAVVHSDASWLRQAVADIAVERGWPSDWLNDGVKGWLSQRDAHPEAKRLFRTYPSEDQPGLRVLVASPHYLFAMKCLAMRVGGVDTTQDRSDIEALAKTIGVTTADQAIEIVAQYYPLSKISPKTQFGIEEIFSSPAGFEAQGLTYEPDMPAVDALAIPRPSSLADVAVRTRGGEPFDLLLREFLDSFYGQGADARILALAHTPAPVDPIGDAYLAAVAEHLARRFELPVPSWTDDESRFLVKPFFAGALESLKAVLLVESPLAFRRRQIFVSANALSRAREHASAS
jgi:hypothetical protein